MKNNSLKEYIVVLALVILAVLLLNPFHFWMPDMMLLAILGIALVVFGIFASFILREGGLDERECYHRMLAGRTAFLSGSAIALAGITVQSYRHAVDPWLVAAFIAMIVAKIGSRIYSEKHL
ncbi:MAG TPA: hypothetical protein VEB60_01285 [Candidatus Paceibacterota bacterium]|nr:hypothetical protein [Candidatus Paceibacterota bacterium]